MNIYILFVRFQDVLKMGRNSKTLPNMGTLSSVLKLIKNTSLEAVALRPCTVRRPARHQSRH